ncbi:MAG: TetR family transcriptional regulator [Rhodobacteraceae bacterium]|nr:TetR family transcriptional regulator [Paracoccaceae bacterium]
MARGLARDHDDKRIAIRKGAARHFARHGYDRASMTALARSCGVSKALIYHYYDSKEMLLFDILEAHLGTLLASVEAVPRPGDDPRGELREVIRAILSAYRDADAEHQVQIDALSALPPDRRAPLVDIQRRLVRHLADALTAVAPLSEGHRRPATMAVFGMLNWFYMWHRPGRDIGREAYADLVTDMVLGGLPALLAHSAEDGPPEA